MICGLSLHAPGFFWVDGQVGNNSYLCTASSEWVHSDLKQSPRASNDNLFPSSHWSVSLGSITDDSVDRALKAKNSRYLTLLSLSLDHKPPYSSTLGEKTELVSGLHSSESWLTVGPTCFCPHISIYGLKDSPLQIPTPVLPTRPATWTFVT